MPTEKIILHVYGPRNLIDVSVTLPTHLLYDFDAILHAYREGFPHVTTEDLLRHIWVRGLAAMRKNVHDGNLPEPKKTPQPVYLIPSP